MSEEQPKLKIVIPPQVLEQMQQEMSPEEIEELFAVVQQQVEAGTLFEQSEPVDLERMKQEDPEEYAALMEAMAQDGFTDFDEWAEYLINHQRPTLN